MSSSSSHCSYVVSLAGELQQKQGTQSQVDMKKDKTMTVVYRIKGKPKRNSGQYRILKSARLKIKA